MNMWNSAFFFSLALCSRGDEAVSAATFSAPLFSSPKGRHPATCLRFQRKIIKEFFNYRKVFEVALKECAKLFKQRPLHGCCNWKSSGKDEKQTKARWTVFIQDLIIQSVNVLCLRGSLFVCVAFSSETTINFRFFPSLLFIFHNFPFPWVVFHHHKKDATTSATTSGTINDQNILIAKRFLLLKNGKNSDSQRWFWNNFSYPNKCPPAGVGNAWHMNRALSLLPPSFLDERKNNQSKMRRKKYPRTMSARTDQIFGYPWTIYQTTADFFASLRSFVWRNKLYAMRRIGGWCKPIRAAFNVR